MGFSRQEYWSGFPFHSPGDLPNPGIEPRSPIDILGISELRWTGMGQFNSDDHYIYYCGQESLRRNGVVIIVNKRVQNAVLGCSPKCGTWIQSQKRQNDFQGKPFNIMVIQVYAPASTAEEAEVEWF